MDSNEIVSVVQGKIESRRSTGHPKPGLIDNIKDGPEKNRTEVFTNTERREQEDYTVDRSKDYPVLFSRAASIQSARVPRLLSQSVTYYSDVGDGIQEDYTVDRSKDYPVLFSRAASIQSARVPRLLSQSVTYYSDVGDGIFATPPAFPHQIRLVAQGDNGQGGEQGFKDLHRLADDCSYLSLKDELSRGRVLVRVRDDELPKALQAKQDLTQKLEKATLKQYLYVTELFKNHSD
ncbi:hypothetical protein EGW08_022722 [Elysia chlorotica]|uniref:Uncharacterized protein n=1 Tax=Elysia chlorotica TaxID=188477 RepID=A0A3S1BKT8_ELYCH|nr:hypothetical protein EGW08_022722 [Elysia chlorotica]